MKLKLRPWFALMCAVSISSAFGHATVEVESPKNGSALGAPPSEIRLQFTEPLEPAFTSVKVFDSSGKEVSVTKKARVENGKTVVLPLPVLAPGGYKAVDVGRSRRASRPRRAQLHGEVVGAGLPAVRALAATVLVDLGSAAIVGAWASAPWLA